MDLWQIILIIVIVVVGILAGLYFAGKKMQGKADSQQSLINQSKQVVSMLVIDKKKIKITKSNLPKMVIDQVPWYLKFRKMSMVKAKIGPKITTVMCDDKIFKEIPVKKQIKVELAGIYIVKLISVKK